jgi:hypothetical protein
MCRTCVPALCQTCTDWVTCERCKDHASVDEVSGECVCDTGYILDESLDACELCHTACSDCYDRSQAACTVCTNGNYLIAPELCLPYCPATTTANKTQRTCNDDASVIGCFTFEGEPDLNDLQSIPPGLRLTTNGGDPMSVYERGICLN